MWEKNLGQKGLIIGGALLLAAIFLVKIDDDGVRLNLKGGQDIAGGTSMIFEINDEGLGGGGQPVAETMKELLQKRVDPKGVLDLQWRVHGKNRIEVQMPLPPAEAKQKQEEYEQALENLFDNMLKRSDVRAAVRAEGDERDAAIAKLAGESAARREALERAARQYDNYEAALAAYREEKAAVDAGTGDQAKLDELEFAMQDAQDLAEDAEDEVLQNELDPAQFARILDLPEETREKSIDDLKVRLPNLAAEIDDTVKKYAKWKSGKGYLDGPADLQRLISGAGVLEFRILTLPTPDNAAKIDRYRDNLEKYGPDPRPGDTDQWFLIDNPVAFFSLDSASDLETFDIENPSFPAILGKVGEDYYVLGSNDPSNSLLHDKGAKWKLKNAYPSQDQSGAPNVVFEFDSVGASRFGDLTGRNIGNQLCILLDDVAYSSARINDKISRIGTITGRFTQEKVMYLVQAMQSGSLPARLKDTPLSERTIGSSLGSENLERALKAAVYGLAFVALFMAIYYMICGLVADVALLLNVVLVLAAMAMLGARFTLPGIAGVILTIGMVVDANVLIFERMREEKERGSSLRMIIKNGYDKAFSTIIDSNITTLLTSLILYYVGSEEIKGFGLTLGWGIVMSLFTSLFVTRTIFAFLVKYKLLTDIKMLQIIKPPTVDWYGKRKLFAVISIVTIALGMFALFSRTPDELFDVEFSGGVAAEVELNNPITDEETIREQLAGVAKNLASYADSVAQATVTDAGPATMQIQMGNVPADLIAAIVTEPLEEKDWLVRGGVDRNVGENAVNVRIDAEDVTAADVQEYIRALADPDKGLPIVERTLGRANLGIVLDADDADDHGRFWNVTTTEKNKRLVQYALEQALGDELVRQPRITYDIRGDDMPYPITDARLVNVIPEFPANVDRDVTDYRGGAAIWFDNLNPPQSVETLETRLQSMRLQPGYQDYPYRNFDVIGVSPTGANSEAGNPIYDSVVLVVGNPPHRYEDAPQLWTDDYAARELKLATATLDTEQSLRRVSQFKPQIAAQSTQKAIMALILSWGMIIAYLWVRFGRVSYGVAGVVALIHDVLIGLGFIGFAWWLGGSNSPIGQALLVENFKIDMTIVAAFLTIIGYSINDTIVIFDRIREVRGRLGVVTPQIINESINQTMSRTIITGVTTFLVLTTMYVLGGSSIRGFNYCMLVGILTGTYSSIAISAPLLMWGIRSTESRAKAPRPATT